MKDSEKIKIKKYFGDIYLEQNGIILDKICPVCKQAIDEKKQFCKCGAFIKKKNNFHRWVILIFSFLVSLFVVTYLNSTYDLKLFGNISFENLQINSLSPVNIQLISSLNGTSYKKYVQNIYTNPNDDSAIFILIRPTLWHMLNEKDKNIILQKVKAKGEMIIKQKYPNLNKKISVKYANAG
ncbi:MAG: hypothetical protein WC197_05845 [Candidatus Gastranaerophilaceae bacterium]|jgi:predicted nucleic acid-binding Zn ribbon protein